MAGGGSVASVPAPAPREDLVNKAPREAPETSVSWQFLYLLPNLRAGEGQSVSGGKKQPLWYFCGFKRQ